MFETHLPHSCCTTDCAQLERHFPLSSYYTAWKSSTTFIRYTLLLSAIFATFPSHPKQLVFSYHTPYDPLLLVCSKNIFTSHPTNIFLFTNASQFHTLLSFTPITNNFPMHTTQRRCNIRRQTFSWHHVVWILQLFMHPPHYGWLILVQLCISWVGVWEGRFRDFLAEFFTWSTSFGKEQREGGLQSNINQIYKCLQRRQGLVCLP
jgi:hypothetical protein